MDPSVEDPAQQPSTTQTRGGSNTKLRDHEEIWASRFEFLKANGYMLRPRYRPGWEPSWKKKGGPSWATAEDAITPGRVKLLDAKRISDGRIVFLKHVQKPSPEIELGRYLSQPELLRDPRNHAVPLLDVLEDPKDPDSAILVFPVLRRIDSPLPASVREAADFVQQTLEGLVFLHEHKIAHRDCAWGNIMMDGRALFPQGWHPQGWLSLPNGSLLPDENPSRTAVGGVRYYFIDFGISTRNQELTVGLPGQEDAPELSEDVPYNPYKLDVYILGMAYQRFLVEQCHGSDFVLPLIKFMTPAKPEDRPSASEALQKWTELHRAMPSGLLARRLSSPESPESSMKRFVNDAFYRVSEAFWGLRPRKTLSPLA